MKIGFLGGVANAEYQAYPVYKTGRTF